MGASTIAATVAGCSAALGDSSEYDQDDHNELLLSEDVFPDGWKRDDEINEHFDATFANEDESIIVLNEVEIEDDVEAAEKSFEDSKSGMRDPVDYDIGDEAFWDTENDEIAITIYRHSNALGQVAAMRQSGFDVSPDKSRSQKYAKEMFDGWSDV